MGCAWLRMAVAKPTSSSTVSPFVRSAASKATICESLTRPESNSSMAALACQRLRFSLAAADNLGTPVVVVKAQIHAGGRGKAGGVKLARSADEAAELAGKMLGMKLVTPQTGPAGRIVKRLLIEEGLDIKRELYLGLLVDRAAAAPVFMASAAGGMEIEEVAREHPGAILRETIHPAVGLQPYQARKIAFGLGLTPEVANAAVPFLQALYRAFIESDGSLAEINPCVVTGDGRLVALA